MMWHLRLRITTMVTVSKCKCARMKSSQRLTAHRRITRYMGHRPGHEALQKARFAAESEEKQGLQTQMSGCGQRYLES